VQIAVLVCSGGCDVYFLFFLWWGCGFHYGPVRQVSTVCEKIYTIMAEVSEKVMDNCGGCVDMGFGTYVLGGHLQ
jgi:hypothetical protein